MSLRSVASEPEVSESGMLIPVLTAFFRHHRLFLYTMTLSFALILSLALVTRKQYRSEMKFLVQNARSTALLSSDRTSSSIVNGVTEEQLNSELEILQSEDVVTAVADPNWDPADVRNRSRQEIRAHAQKVAKLSSHLTVDPIAKEDIMSISYMADSPQEANEVLTALSAAYLVRHEKLRRPTGASSFFVEQAKLYDDDLKAATQKLVDFQQLHHIASVPDVEDSLQRSLLADEEALRTIQLKLRESTASIGGAQSILAGVAPRQQTQQRVVPSELLLQQLKTSLVSLSNRRTELLNRYQPTDRLVTEVDDQIAEVKRTINAETSNQNVENTTDVNPSWQQLQTSLVQEQINHDSLAAGQIALGQQLGQLRAQLAETQGLELTFDQLRSQMDDARSNYKAFVEKRDLAHTEDAMDASKLLNVTVMETPTFPYAPARPKPMLNLVLGIPTSLFLAAAAVYLAETSRKNISTPRELDEAVSYPVLGTVPFVSGFGDAENQRV